MFLLYVFLVYNIYCADKLLAKELSLNPSVNKHCSNQDNNNIDSVDTSKVISHPLNTLDDDGIKVEKPATSDQRTVTTIHFEKETINKKQKMNANVGSSNSGLIQTITMDLQPDRDTFLPLKASNLRMDYETRPADSSYSPFTIIHHGLVVNNDHSHFIDDVNNLQGLQQQQYKPYSGQWQQRLYSDIGDKISSQYVL